MLQQPEALFERYLCGMPVQVETRDTTHAQSDKRYVYILDSDRDEHIVIKAAKNAFTTPDRVAGWQRLAELYNACGIYAPRIRCDRTGAVCIEHEEAGERFVVYAEEKMKYREVNLLAPEAVRYWEDIVRATARIARVSTDLPDWKTAWCLYDRFSDEDETDETWYWQETFRALIQERMPEFNEQAERIWQRFLSLYRALEAPYRALPQAFFQGDVGNALLDEEGRFVGFFDFNLAGAEVNMNYLFRELCRVYLTGADIARLDEPELWAQKDALMHQKLTLVKKYYPFSEAERATFPLYYRVVYPLGCDLCQAFEKVIRAGDAEGTKRILDWIERQQTREDIAL